MNHKVHHMGILPPTSLSPPPTGSTGTRLISTVKNMVKELITHNRPPFCVVPLTCEESAVLSTLYVNRSSLIGGNRSSGTHPLIDSWMLLTIANLLH